MVTKTDETGPATTVIGAPESADSAPDGDEASFKIPELADGDLDLVRPSEPFQNAVRQYAAARDRVVNSTPPQKAVDRMESLREQIALLSDNPEVCELLQISLDEVEARYDRRRAGVRTFVSVANDAADLQKIGRALSPYIREHAKRLIGNDSRYNALARAGVNVTFTVHLADRNGYSVKFASVREDPDDTIPEDE